MPEEVTKLIRRLIIQAYYQSKIKTLIISLTFCWCETKRQKHNYQHDLGKNNRRAAHFSRGLFQVKACSAKREAYETSSRTPIAIIMTLSLPSFVLIASIQPAVECLW